MQPLESPEKKDEEKFEEESETMFMCMKKAAAVGSESCVVLIRSGGKQIKSRKGPEGFEELIADECEVMFMHEKREHLIGEKGDAFVDVYGDNDVVWGIVEKLRWRRNERAWYEVRMTPGEENGRGDADLGQDRGQGG